MKILFAIFRIFIIANMIFIIAFVFTFIIKLRFPKEVSIANNSYIYYR